MARDVDDTWGMTSHEERHAGRAISGAGCAWTFATAVLVVLGLLVAGYVFLRDVALELDSSVCSALKPGGSIRFINEPADFVDFSALPSTPSLSLAVTDESYVSPVGLVAVDGRSPVKSELVSHSAAFVDPEGRYLVDYQGATKQRIVDLAERRVLAEVTGDTSQIVFTGSDRGLLFFGESNCDLRGARRFDLATRSSEVFEVEGMSDGVAPVGRIGRDLIVAHVVPGSSSSQLDGISRIDLKTGETRRIARHGDVLALVPGAERLWLSTGRGLKVVDLRGRVISNSTLQSSAAPLPDGRVAYIRVLGAQYLLQLANPDGPSEEDLALPIAHSGQLLAAPGGTQIVIVWVESDHGGYDLCDVVLQTCRTILEEEYFPLLATPLGFVATPIPGH